MLALHIYNNKSKQSLQKFFFITFSLSTELLEDKQKFKLGGVDTSLSYLLFQTLLPLFWTLTCMIAELPWCFQQNCHGVIYVQKQKFLE